MFDFALDFLLADHFHLYFMERYILCLWYESKQNDRLKQCYDAEDHVIEPLRNEWEDVGSNEDVNPDELRVQIHHSDLNRQWEDLA